MIVQFLTGSARRKRIILLLVALIMSVLLIFVYFPHVQVLSPLQDLHVIKMATVSLPHGVITQFVRRGLLQGKIAPLLRINVLRADKSVSLRVYQALVVLHHIRLGSTVALY